MSDVLPIKLQVTGDTKAVAAVRKEIEQLAAASSKTSTQASAASAKQAQAYSKIQIASSNVAVAEQRRAAATSNAAAADSRAAAAASNATAAHARSEIAILRLAQAQTKAAQSSNYFAQVGASVKSSLLGIIGPAAAVGTAIAVIKGGADLAVVGANADLVAQRFDGLAASAHTTGEALLSALRASSGGEISDLNLQLAANKAQLLGVADSAEEFGTLMSIARDRAQQMGISTTQAFNDLVTGLGRGSALILDNLGITVSVTEANEAYAASLGKTANELTEAESKQALINAVLTQGKASLDATGGAVQSTAGTFAQLGTASENAKTSVGALLAEILKIPAQKTTTILIKVAGNLEVLAGADQQLQEFAERAFSGAKSFEEYEARVKSVNDQLAPFGASIGRLSAESYNYAQSLIATGSSAEEAYNKALQYSGVVEKIAAVQQAAGGSGGTWATVLSSLGERAAEVASQSDYSRAAVEGLATAFAAGGITSDQFAAALAVLEARHIAAANAATQDALEENRLAIAHGLVAQQATGLSQAILKEIADKQQSTVESQRLTAAQELLASIGAAVASGQITAGQGALNFAAMTGVAIAKARELINLQAQLAGGKGGVTEGRAERDTAGDLAAARAAGAAAARERAAAVKAARDQQTLAVGTSQQKQALLKADYEAAVKAHGAESAEAINAQTKLLQATTQGAAARTSASGAATTKLEGIETKTGEKLSQIVQDTQAKLIAIDQKAADERARIAAELENKLATSAADRRAANEADDLDLIGVTDEKAAQKLNDREQAQAKAREREVAAAKEAQDAIANGEAESASKVYDIREKQIGDQQALDEKYAERQRELAGNEEQLDALKTQYDEATRANEEAANTRIAIAKAEAEQKKAEVQAEKDAVIAAANEQANQVVSAAERSAAGVTKATSAARTSSVANLKAIGDAVTAIPSSKTITITVNQQGTVGASSSGGGAPAARAGGGDTNVGRVTLVGEQGPELVVFSSPGRVYPAGQTQAMLASGTIPGLATGGTIDAGGGYTTPIAGGPVATSGGGGGGKKTAAPQSAKDALAEQKEIVALLSDMIQLRHDLEEELRTGQPFNVEAVEWLAKRAAQFVQLVKSNLIPTTKADGEGLKRYTDAAKESIGVLSDVAQLRHDLQTAAHEQPFNMDVINGLVVRAQQFTEKVRGMLVPTSEVEVDQISHYADAVSATVGILSDVANLRHDLQDAAGEQPFDMALIRGLADTAALVTLIVRERLVPTSEAQADAFGLYADSVSGAVSILSDVLSLGKDIADGSTAPISDAVIIGLADQAVRITTLVQGRLIPVTEAQNDAVSAYADMVGSSVSVLKDVAGLGKDLFTDYVSPTDAQIALLATDAKRVTQGFFDAGAIMGKEGAEAGKAYAEGVGAAFSAAKDGLLVIDALKSGDFVLPDNALAQFESSSLDILTTMEALGARAALIPMGDIAALSSVTAAIGGQAEALIKLAAVPFGDLGGASAGLRGSGGALGGATTITNYNTFQLPQGTPQQIATEAMRLLNQQMGSRR